MLYTHLIKNYTISLNIFRTFPSTTNQKCDQEKFIELRCLIILILHVNYLFLINKCMFVEIFFKKKANAYKWYCWVIWWFYSQSFKESLYHLPQQLYKFKLILPYENIQPTGICCMAQETQTGALYQSRRVRWGGRWKGVSKRRGYMYTYS